MTDRPLSVEMEIVNRRGLHARAAAKFVQTASRFEADIKVSKDGTTVSGTSIMGLMMLAAGPGALLHIVANGPEGPEALAALVELIECGFGEEMVEGG